LFQGIARGAAPQQSHQESEIASSPQFHWDSSQ
jgi:hypothetical protein